MKRRNRESGFTLIELLVVVAIIGILAAIAIPQFNAYKINAHNSSAVSDTRNAATALEAYYVDNSTFVSCQVNFSATGLPTCIGLIPGIGEVSSDSLIELLSRNGGQAYYAAGCSSKGDRVYRLESETAVDTASPGIVEATIEVGQCATWLAS